MSAKGSKRYRRRKSAGQPPVVSSPIALRMWTALYSPKYIQYQSSDGAWPSFDTSRVRLTAAYTPAPACRRKNPSAGRRTRPATLLPMVAPSPSPVRYRPSSVPNVKAVDFSITPSSLNHTISSDKATNPANAKSAAQTGKLNVRFAGVRAASRTLSVGVALPSACPARARKTPAAAHPRLRNAARRAPPSRPVWGSTHHVVARAPIAAPSVFSAYSQPTVDPALPIFLARPRARRGSETPMKNVGQRSAMKSRPAVVGKPRPRWPTRS